MRRYSAAFFRSLATASRQAAEVIVPFLVDLLHPTSVVDIGCGTGEWLAVFNKYGVEDVLGIDGNRIPESQLSISPQRFMQMDLARGFQLDRVFALAVCIEVGEHLPPQSADDLVSGLTNAAPVVLFSAAIPGQGGNGHINEQWPSYWLSRFADHGFDPVNCLRGRIWTNQNVEAYLAQNLVLLACRDRLEQDSRLMAEWKRGSHFPVDVVHPNVYLGALDRVRLKGPAGLARRAARFARKRLRSQG
jgi:SAM-dependent methyltransferase